jgi:hypothetical protein
MRRGIRKYTKNHLKELTSYKDINGFFLGGRSSLSLVALGFELRALDLLGKPLYHFSHTTSLTLFF